MTIIKNNPNTLTGSNFEIAELARDYLDITWSYNSAPQSVTSCNTLRLITQGLTELALQ